MKERMTTNEERSVPSHVWILKALMELPFAVGKNLLVDFVVGDYANKSITNNRLDELSCFDTFPGGKEQAFVLVEELIRAGCIDVTASDYNPFVKVLKLTVRGHNEIVRPTLYQPVTPLYTISPGAHLSEQDLQSFEAYENFLGPYDVQQKKAIVSDAKNILCIAGAGSGKTTVLTKRIEFLIRHKKVHPSKILAITFTRKARKEMEKRLTEHAVQGVSVETFNSFCEKILREHEAEIYGRRVGVQSYGDKILAMNMAFADLGLNPEQVVDSYFSPQQKKFKAGHQLIKSFMNDCFSVIEYFKVTGQEAYDFSQDADDKNRENAKMIYRINQYLKEHLKIQGLRDYCDQLIDAVNFLKDNPQHLPCYEYILVDEYQDVNAKQIELLKLLNAPHLFVVGDPRQSIFGWRGSDISYILNFSKEYGEHETVYLTKNYRSDKKIVSFMNTALRSMNLPDLEHHRSISDAGIHLLDFESEQAEREFILKEILSSSLPRHEIFVLSRTNRQLQELSQLLKMANIVHVVKTDEVKNPVVEQEGAVTLATVHAIKGLEAKTVFLMGATEQNFPCKTSDHPAIEMIKTDNYNKLEEEKRLFYVAISRAKEKLYITYSGKKHTHFISEEMKRVI